ncbi:BPL-N domain-containing protein [Rhizobium binxianense]
MTILKLADRGAFTGTPLTFLNRCRAHRIPASDSAEGFAVDGQTAEAAASLGLTGETAEGLARTSGSPRIAIYAGEAIGYPYWAYYAHALLSLGLTFSPVDGRQIAAGALSEFDLLIMPGGFATWGLDRAESLSGIDAAIHAFISAGGAFMGSCGGGFYASDGRPGWLRAIDATPNYTQEYLSTGAAVLGISITDPILERGLPEAIELPYYHGPVYSNSTRTAVSLGHFRNFISESRLFIDNPLAPSLFDREMKNTPAVLSADLGRGKVLVFSPHPEMGEFLRKGIVLEAYVRRFLPIRGFKVMDETLRFFMKEDCAGFRLIYNALVYLGLFERRSDSTAPGMEKGLPHELLRLLDELDRAMTASFGTLETLARSETDEMRHLLSTEFGRLGREWRDVLAGMRAECAGRTVDVRVVSALADVLRASIPSLDAPSKLTETLVLTELPVRLCAAGLRIMRCDNALETYNENR